MSNVTREAKTSGTKKKTKKVNKKLDSFQYKKNNTNEATHQLNVSYFDHLIEILAKQRK